MSRFGIYRHHVVGGFSFSSRSRINYVSLPDYIDPFTGETQEIFWSPQYGTIYIADQEKEQALSAAPAQSYLTLYDSSGVALNAGLRNARGVMSTSAVADNTANQVNCPSNLSGLWSNILENGNFHASPYASISLDRGLNTVITSGSANSLNITSTTTDSNNVVYFGIGGGKCQVPSQQYYFANTGTSVQDYLNFFNMFPLKCYLPQMAVGTWKPNNQIDDGLLCTIDNPLDNLSTDAASNIFNFNLSSFDVFPNRRMTTYSKMKLQDQQPKDENCHLIEFTTNIVEPFSLVLYCNLVVLQRERHVSESSIRFIREARRRSLCGSGSRGSGILGKYGSRCDVWQRYGEYARVRFPSQYNQQTGRWAQCADYGSY